MDPLTVILIGAFAAGCAFLCYDVWRVFSRTDTRKEK